MLLALAILMANAQCLAACESFLCAKSGSHRQAADVAGDSHCHQPAPSDKGDGGETDCATHPAIVSEAGAQAVQFMVHDVAVAILPAGMTTLSPQAGIALAPAFDRPPPTRAFSTITVLRV